MKLQTWKIKLDKYDSQIEYKKGNRNRNVDTLSRIKPEDIAINNIEYEEEAHTLEEQTERTDANYNDFLKKYK